MITEAGGYSRRQTPRTRHGTEKRLSRPRESNTTGAAVSSARSLHRAAFPFPSLFFSVPESNRLILPSLRIHVHFSRLAFFQAMHTPTHERAGEKFWAMPRIMALVTPPSSLSPPAAVAALTPGRKPGEKTFQHAASHRDGGQRKQSQSFVSSPSLSLFLPLRLLARSLRGSNFSSPSFPLLFLFPWLQVAGFYFFFLIYPLDVFPISSP